MLLSNEEFFARLKTLFESKRTSGSVFLTQKRCTSLFHRFHNYLDLRTDTYDDGKSETMDIDLETKRYPCLLRAQDAKTIKFSTLVQPDDLVSFSTAYGSLLKANLSLALRKRDKKKEKQRDKKRGKGAATTSTTANANALPKLTKVVGPRRGNGRDKRQRTIKRRLKDLARLRATRTRLRRTSKDV